jgi:septal ring factor EnvC (AmiA/AmiB activator)
MAKEPGWSWTTLTDSTAFWAFVTAVLMYASQVLAVRWAERGKEKAKELDVSTESVRLAQVSQQAVVAQLFELCKTLRNDMAELRAELEESERRRIAAEREVQQLSDDVYRLRRELARLPHAVAEPLAINFKKADSDGVRFESAGS